MDKLTRTLDNRAIAPKANGVVYIKGSPVDRPGVYNIPAGGATLRRMTNDVQYIPPKARVY